MIQSKVCIIRILYLLVYSSQFLATLKIYPFHAAAVMNKRTDERTNEPTMRRKAATMQFHRSTLWDDVSYKACCQLEITRLKRYVLRSRGIFICS